MAKTSSKEKEKSSKSKAQAAAIPASTPASNAKLGTKRTCPKCSTKFYDFCKEELNCPKCNAKLKASQLVNVPNIPHAEPKKQKSAEKVVTEALSQDEGSADAVVGGDAFESVEDLGDDDTVVEEIDVDDEEDKKTDY